MTRNTISTVEDTLSRNSISTVKNTFSIGKSTRSGPESVARENNLFHDSLLDSGVERKRRTWTTLFSVGLQSLLIGTLILLPLWFTDALPQQQLVTFLVAPPPPPPPPPPAASTASPTKAVKVSSNIVEGRLLTPSKVPTKVHMITEEEAPPPPGVTGGVIGGVPGGTPGGQLDGVIGGIIRSNSYVPVVHPVSKPAQPTVQRVRVSQGVTQGLLIYRIEPTYPTPAHNARIQGTVVLAAVIGKDGSVSSLRLVNGNPMLANAAIDAVKQWRYKPFLLNGQPVEIETTVTVNFALLNG
jgi:protein TonB